jgi:hypothetical protein
MNAGPIQSVIAYRLPRARRWLIGGSPLDFSFYSGLWPAQPPRNLTAVTEECEWDATLVEHASDFIVFGERDYGEGGGARPWLVVRRSDGKVFGVDVEREVPVFLLNSSLQAFINTFYLLDKYLGHGDPVPPDLHSLAQNLDPTVYSKSEWHDLVDLVAAL